MLSGAVSPTGTLRIISTAIGCPPPRPFFLSLFSSLSLSASLSALHRVESLHHGRLRARTALFAVKRPPILKRFSARASREEEGKRNEYPREVSYRRNR